jgi:AcrR family transcriptional regulator
MASARSDAPGRAPRPMRADARRNYEKLIRAARDAFAADAASASLEDIARRAQVGIGTLYRHFPTRQDLLEAVSVDRDAEVFRTCGASIFAAGTRLLERAQDAGAVRRDTDFADVGRLVGGIAVIRPPTRGQIERLLDIALDGLRSR